MLESFMGFPVVVSDSGPKISDELRSQIIEHLKTWDDPDSLARKRFNEAMERIKKRRDVIALEEAIRRSDPSLS